MTEDQVDPILLSRQLILKELPPQGVRALEEQVEERPRVALPLEDIQLVARHQVEPLRVEILREELLVAQLQAGPLRAGPLRGAHPLAELLQVELPPAEAHQLVIQSDHVQEARLPSKHIHIQIARSRMITSGTQIFQKQK